MIREFKPNDIDNVMQIWLETNILAHPFIPKSYWQDNFSAVNAVMTDACVEIYIFEDCGEIRGFIGLIENNIAGLFVKSGSQSQGIGKSLLDYCKMKYQKLALRVYQKNLRAIEFYKRESFVITCEGIDENTEEREFIMKWTKEDKNDAY